MKSDAEQKGHDDAGKRAELLSGFISELESMANSRVASRKNIEERWIEDLRQYHGKYPEDVTTKLNERENRFRSKVFKNKTRKKTNAMIARLFNLLFPTDDRNWSIEPTPVPDIDDKAKSIEVLHQDAGDTFADIKRRLTEAENREDEPSSQEYAAEMAEAEEVIKKTSESGDKLREIKDEATKRCDLMRQEIDDQLVQCDYPSQCRNMIEDGVKIGSGVLKGPVKTQDGKYRWVKNEDGDFQRVLKQKNAPSVSWVDPWSFFPSLDIRDVRNSEGIFERHLQTAEQMRKLAKMPDVDENAIRAILHNGITVGEQPSYLVDLRSLTLQNDQKGTDRFIVWEYTGAIDKDKMKLLADGIRGSGEDREQLLSIIEDADILEEMHARVMFCQGHLLFFALHPLDSNEPIYSVFNLEEDESSPFGFGMPYLLRDDQSILNSANRMMMDNAGFSVGPQIVVRKSMVSPEDGDWTLRPLKIWHAEDGDLEENKSPFQAINIPTNQGELANIIGMTKEDMDDTSSISPLTEGEQGAEVTKTFQGMALLVNAANVIFTRFVKNFDDNVTIPMIGRCYDWNMQFSEREEIKGDYDVKARGSDVLLVREMQSSNILMILQMFSDDPDLKFYLKRNEMIQVLFRAHSLDTHKFIRSDADAEKLKKEESERLSPEAEALKVQLENQGKEIELKRAEIDAKVQMHNQEWDARREISRLDYAKTMDISVAQINAEMAKLEASQNDRSEAEMIKAESAEIRIAAEIDALERTGKSSGGAI